MFDYKSFSKKIVYFIIIYASFFLSLFIYQTYAKYITSKNNNLNVSVAKPIIVYNGLKSNGESSLSLPIDSLNPTSGAKNYTFEVVNQNNEMLTDVNIDYVLTISTTNNMPFLINIRNENDNLSKNLISTMNGERLTVTFNGNLSHSVNLTHAYTVEISWLSAYKNWEYANLLDVIEISVDWVQQSGEEL